MSIRNAVARVLPVLFLPSILIAQPAPTPPATSIAAKTTGFDRRDGFIPLYLDTKQGKLYAELPRGTTHALFWVSLATGFGSNPVGLDRGANGNDQRVRFEREGERVLMVFENTSFRTSLDNLWMANATAGLPSVAGAIGSGMKLYEELTGERV